MRHLLFALASVLLAAAASADTKVIYAGTLFAVPAADIIAVPQDPTRDIKVMERVSFVMRGGAIYVGQ